MMTPEVTYSGSNGLFFTHECTGLVILTERLPLADSHWRIENIEPLTVAPSIHCLDCGTHGWFRNGEWSNA